MTRALARVLCLVAALLGGAVGVVMTPAAAYACDCSQRSPARALRDADVVFRGTVTKRDVVQLGHDARVDFRFQVDEVYRGIAYTDQVVASASGSDCGFDPAVGTTWVVFATEDVAGTGSRAVNRLVTNECSGNLRGSQPPGFVGQPRLPNPGASDRQEKAVAADAQLTRALVVGGLVTGSVVVLAGVGLGLLWRRGRPVA